MEFLAALGFLTILPVPTKGKPDLRLLGRSLAYFPMVGLTLGLILAGLDRLLLWLLPRAAADALLIVMSVVLSGALHVDGLIDTCDALFGPGDPESRLKRLKDPRAGAFGVVGAFCLLLVKYGALLSLNPSIKPYSLLVAPTLGRWGMAYAISLYPYKEGPGTGRVFQEGVSLRAFLVATATALVTSAASLRATGLMVMLASWLVTVAMAHFALKRIPGLSGDVYGAMNEVVEALVLLVAASRG